MNTCFDPGLDARHKGNWAPRAGSLRDFTYIGLLECQDCGLVTPDKDVSASVDYASGSMHSWVAGYGGQTPPPESDVSRRLRSIADMIPTASNPRLLDFGCGAGEMLDALTQVSKPEGLEPEISMRKMGESRGFKMLESLDQAIDSESRYDLVTLFHVIEHIYNPVELMTGVRRLLNPGGAVVLETPNANDALLTKYKSEAFQNFSYWSHHPMLYTKRSLTEMLLSAGFTSIRVAFEQRYSIDNHLNWLVNKSPGGHAKTEWSFSDVSKQAYNQDLIEAEISDTLWCVAY